MVFINTIQNLVRKEELWETRSYKTATAIAMGRVVEMNSSGNVALATADFEAIGFIDNMPDYRAKEETGTVASGDIAQVKLFGKSFKAEAGGTFTAGLYVKFSTGKVIASAAFGTTVSDFIALATSTAAGQIIEIMER